MSRTSKTQQLKGRAKEAVGVAAGNDRLKKEGRTDQAKASTKQAGESAKDAVNNAAEAVREAGDALTER